MNAIKTCIVSARVFMLEETLRLVFSTTDHFCNIRLKEEVFILGKRGKTTPCVIWDCLDADPCLFFPDPETHWA